MEAKDEKPTEVEETEWELKPSGPLSPEQEQNLKTFLSKLSVACKEDKSVPLFVGEQVNVWLKEMEEKAQQK